MPLGSLVMYGCAAHPVDLGRPAAAGHIAARAGRPGVVVAAPHGTSDGHTGEIVAAIGERTGFAVVIATGFSLEPDTRERPGRRYQVNRPFEGVPGRPPSEEIATDEARRVYDAWERRVREAAQGPLRLYVEVHGNNHRGSSAQIEIATVGVDRDDALRLRALFELIRDAHLRGHPERPRLQVAIEPADAVRYRASGAKRDGVLRLPERALHIELPRAARVDVRDVYTVVLAEFLRETAALLSAAR